MDPLQLDLSESFSLEEFQLTYPMCSKELNVEGRKAHFPWISIKKVLFQELTMEFLLTKPFFLMK